MRDGLLPRMEARQWASDPSRVSYRYHPLGGKPVALGTDRDAAIRKVLDMNGLAPGHGSVQWLWEQWQASKRYKRLSPSTQADYALAWKQVEREFGRIPAGSVRAPMVARYCQITRADSPRRADIEKTLLSNLFRHGITLGVCEVNPTIGVEAHGSEASTVMPETAALAAFLRWLSAQSPQRQVIGHMAEYASLAGNRRCEFLSLTWMQVSGGEVRTIRAKQRGKKREQVVEVVAVTPRLQALLDRLPRTGTYLFPTRSGGAYTDRGFKTLWQRCVIDAIKAGVLRPEQRFNFHALRRYYATMYKAETGGLPNLHADPATTARVYDGTRVEGRSALR